MRSRRSRTCTKNRRRAVATVWTILTVPVVLVGLAGVIELGHLWIVRNELQTSLESAALAGVKTWADLSEADGHSDPDGFDKTSAARTAAQAAFAVNPIFGDVFLLNSNGPMSESPGYDNVSCAGDIVLGGFTNSSLAIFSPSANVGCGRTDMMMVSIPDEDFAVLAQKTIVVTPLVKSVFGVTLPSFNVSSRAIAIARCEGGSATVLNPQLVHVTTITCP